jgi:hypothetical protein
MTNEDDDVSRAQGWVWDAVAAAAQAWRIFFLVQGDVNHRMKPYPWHGIPPPLPPPPLRSPVLRLLRLLSETCELPGLLCKLQLVDAMTE